MRTPAEKLEGSVKRVIFADVLYGDPLYQITESCFLERLKGYTPPAPLAP